MKVKRQKIKVKRQKTKDKSKKIKDESKKTKDKRQKTKVKSKKYKDKSTEKIYSLYFYLHIFSFHLKTLFTFALRIFVHYTAKLATSFNTKQRIRI
jgi:hypothetical protein